MDLVQRGRVRQIHAGPSPVKPPDLGVKPRLLAFDQTLFSGYCFRLQMDCSRTTKTRRIALVLLLAAGFCTLSARAQGDGGAPAATPARTDEQPANTGKGTFREIEEEFFGPSQPYGSSGAIDRLMNQRPQGAAPMLPRMDDEKTRLSKQREQEWIFTDLNALNSPQSLQEMAGVPEYGQDGQDKSKMSPMERYLEELGEKRGAVSNYMDSVTGLSFDQKGFFGSNSMNSMTLMQPGMNELMGDMAGSSNAAAADTHELGSSLNDNTPTPSKSVLQDQQRRLDDFKRLLSTDSSGTAPAASPGTFGTSSRFSDLLNFGAPPVSTGTPAAASAAPAAYPGSLSPTLGSVLPTGSGYHSSMNVTQPTTFTVPGATRLTSLPPPPAPTQKPVSLDPFKDNMPKRAF